MADPASRSGAVYFDPRLLDWLDVLHAPHDAAQALAFEAPRKAGMPQIQVAQSEGKLVAMLLSMIGARRVVEVGTLAGYSAITMARALGDDGHLWTIELDPKHAAVARASIAAAGLADRITVCVGAATEVLPTLETHGPFCAVFVDADKGNYDRYGRWAAAHVRRGGLLLGDNSFYFGRLLAEDEPAAAAMRRFHEEAREAFDTVNVPTPDGLLVGIRR
jgi:caffeoyl-CoA O-methyltransferase